MNRIEKLNQLQQECIRSIFDSIRDGNTSNIVLASVSFGKALIAYHFVYELLKQGYIQLGETICFRVCYQSIIDNQKAEAKKYNKIFNKDVLNDFNWEFTVNGSTNANVEIIDEYDSLITDTRINKLFRKAKYKLFMSGTESADKPVFADKAIIDGHQMIQDEYSVSQGKITSFITKGQLASMLGKVVYKYTTQQGLQDGILKPFETVIVNHNLGHNTIYPYTSKDKCMIATTEARYYDNLEWQSKQYHLKHLVMTAGRKKANLLHNLPSKIPLFKAICNKIEKSGNKAILFGMNRHTLSACINPYHVVWSKNDTTFADGKFKYSKIKNKKGQVYYTKVNIKSLAYYSSKFPKKHPRYFSQDEYEAIRTLWKSNVIVWDELRDKFNNGDIRVIGSAKSIGRGISLEELDRTVLFSYSKQYDNLMQGAVGRLVRHSSNNGKIIIPITRETLEPKWFANMTKQMSRDKTNVLSEFDLNVTRQFESTTLLTKLKKLGYG